MKNQNNNSIRIQKIYGTDETVHEQALNDKKYTREWEIFDINYSKETNITTYYWKRKTYHQEYNNNMQEECNEINNKKNNNSILKKKSDIRDYEYCNKKEKTFSFSSSSEGDE